MHKTLLAVILACGIAAPAVAKEVSDDLCLDIAIIAGQKDNPSFFEQCNLINKRDAYLGRLQKDMLVPPRPLPRPRPRHRESVISHGVEFDISRECLALRQPGSYNLYVDICMRPIPLPRQRPSMMGRKHQKPRLLAGFLS